LACGTISRKTGISSLENQEKLKYLGTIINVKLINQNYFHDEVMNGFNLGNV
jgi:hypothetical protein